MSAKKTLEETDENNEIHNLNEDGNKEGTNITEVLKKLKMVIDKHLNNAEREIKATTLKTNKSKPSIKKIEKVQMRIPFLERKRTDVTWADVVSRRKTTEKRTSIHSEGLGSDTTDDPAKYKKKRTTIKQKARKPEEIIEKKIRKTAAIAITTRRQITNKEIMLRAKKEIVLKEIGIDNCVIRSGFTGGLVIEIPGEEAEKKADVLATKLSNIFANEQVRINRPKIKADIKITGLEETTTNEEIQDAISKSGECLHTDIKINARRTTIRGNGIA